MRSKQISLAAAIAVAAGIASTVALPAAQAGAATTAVALPIAHYSHLLVDPVHRHLFVSGGSGSTDILVTDYTGQTVATIPNETDANGLALSADGGTVYAGLGGTDAVSAISTADLTETARYATGAGYDPESVAVSGGKVWFSYNGSAAGSGGIGSIDPAAGPAAVTLRATGDSWYDAPLLAGGPNGELVAGWSGVSPASLASYDVSGATVRVLKPQTQLDTPDVSSNLRDLAITPDGKDVITACGAPYAHQAWKVADLSADGQYTDATYPDAVAIAADGTVYGGSDDYYGDSVYVFAPGGYSSAVRSYPLQLDTDLAPAGLAVTPDNTELFGVTTDVYGNNPTLHVVSDPAQTASSVNLFPPATAKPKRALTITGSLGGPSPYTGGQTLTVTRDGVALPAVTTAADGSFSLTDTPPDTGTVSYQVSYAGDEHLAAAQSTATVTVQH
ncbi:Ig-like domain-containing protein [Phaeacidiphilus oryzae]|uniref:Ig-like domain-containing protein n=1 Tax=Phaeacidiphilus oryzae TaxID=348818 RepID=UPI00068DA42E|nr:Ig-like domain-containing protein [Phaeacidiphilus oryzae]